MKKVRLLLFVFILVLGLTACGKNEEGDTQTTNSIHQDSSFIEISESQISNEPSTSNDVPMSSEPVIDEAFEVEQEDETNESYEENEESKLVSIDRGKETLNLDYKYDIISTDEYVRYMLYDIYNDSRLKSEYRSNINIPTDIHRLVEEHIDDLSSETLQYYWDKISLQDLIVSAEENEHKEASWMKGFKNPFVLEVQAASGPDALDQVLVSSKGNFVVWYAIKGKYAITYEDAYEIGENLENAVSKYEELTGNTYSFKANTYSLYEGFFYNNLKILLRRNGYDKSYLENAMQVYVADIEKPLASYNAGPSSAVSAILNSIREIDLNGSPIFPYIIVNSKITNRKDSTTQVCYHEFFHHIQRSVTKGNQLANSTLISEATANWFSAKVSGAIEGENFLNDHAAVMLEYSDKIFTYLVNNYDEATIGYLLFPYFQLYEKHVEDGVNKILDCMKQEDGLVYLEEQATQEERIAIMKDLTMHNLEQNISNGVTLASPYRNSRPPIASDIKADKKDGIIRINKSIQQFHVDYHRLTFNEDWLKNDDYVVKYRFNEKSSNTGNIALQVIGAKELEGITVYSTISSHILHSEEYEMQLSSEICKKYDELYFAVSNASLTTSSNYSLNVDMENVVSSNTEENSETDEIIFENEEQKYYYDMALTIKEQVDEFFRAVNQGDIQTLKKYCYNEEGYTEDDWDEDSFYHIMDYKCASQVLQLLLGDVKYYFSDKMVLELAQELEYHYRNEHEYMHLIFPYSKPFGFLTEAHYLNSFSKGTRVKDLIYNGYCTEEEAISILEKCTANINMQYTTEPFCRIILDEQMKLTFDLDSLLYLYGLPNGGYMWDIPDEDRYLNELAVELSGSEGQIIGTTEQYTDNKEQYDLLENYLLNLDFKGLEEYLFQVLNASDCEELKKYQNEFGRYEDLTEAQKKFVDQYIQENFKFTLVDYMRTKTDFYDAEKYEITSTRGGYYILEYPITFFTYNGLNEFPDDKDKIIQWSIENDIKYIQFKWFTDSKSDLYETYQKLKYFFIDSYYHLIYYARNNIAG